jgi:hypothetical protein
MVGCTGIKIMNGCIRGHAKGEGLTRMTRIEARIKDKEELKD